MSEPSAPVYRLTRRRAGGTLLGLAPIPLVLLTVGVVALIVLPVLAGALAVGVLVAVICGLLAVLPAPGGPLYQMLPLAVRHLTRRARGADRWAAPLPLLTGSATVGERSTAQDPGRLLPPVLQGLDIVAAPRPAAGGSAGTVAPIGLVRDRRSGTLTVLLAARGGEFALLDPAEQHQRLSAWSMILAHAARDPALARLGWSLCSAPAPLTEHRRWLAERTREAPEGGGYARAAADYQELLDAAAPTLTQHDLRLWLTIDTRRLPRRADPADAAVRTALMLLEQCQDAGLDVAVPDSPVQIAEAVRLRADPTVAATLTGVRRSLAEQTGLASVLAGVHAGPMVMRTHWDAVEVDNVWHRLFWVAQWPALGLQPGWLDPLLVHAEGMRTLSVLCEPVSARLSRRRITSDAVQVESAVAAREKYSFRVPTHLASAQAAVDQREIELHGGHSEYGYLALVDVAAATRDELDQASRRLADRAAQTGITELRALHGRHDLAWASSLPLGRGPGRGLRTTVR
ncbi:SCO6880 family protein [Frankia gtarii]|uniref:SCO6880 family protein n=1 Tax=Frankia gtarii TaxID=2950102 RepID=UPI0021C19BD9|nr:SCO6880 family protein [Frankia gtarii]